MRWAYIAIPCLFVIQSPGAKLRAQRATTSFHVLQPLADTAKRLRDPIINRDVFYVPTMLSFVRWGKLPNSATPAAITVPSGSLVTFDLVSHEGVLEDQGRDPVRFFAQHGIPREQILTDAIRVAASSISHEVPRDGPHVISPTVAVAGAERGDVLKIDVVALTPRVPYGVNSIRHGKGSLPEQFPATPQPEPGADAAHAERFHNVSMVIPIRAAGSGWEAVFRAGNGREIVFPVHPFVGTMGVALDTTADLSTVPPGAYGGNLDLKHLTVGSTLYLPVQVPGARFFMSDSHFNAGNGEVDLTSIEGSLRATVRLTLLKAGSAAIPMGRLAGPFAETPDYWIPIGLDPDLDEAMRRAVRQGVEFLVARFGMTPTEAYAYLSIRTDFDVTEVVDATKGIHGLIAKKDFEKTAAKSGAIRR
jgi:acetamidase/formamidase